MVNGNWLMVIGKPQRSQPLPLGVTPNGLSRSRNGQGHGEPSPLTPGEICSFFAFHGAGTYH